MNDKIKRFEQALARQATESLVDFWNDLEADLQKREDYIGEIEWTNLQLQHKITELKDALYVANVNLNFLRAAYDNMKLISQVNGVFVSKGINPYKQ